MPTIGNEELILEHNRSDNYTPPYVTEPTSISDISSITRTRIRENSNHTESIASIGPHSAIHELSAKSPDNNLKNNRVNDLVANEKDGDVPWHDSTDMQGVAKHRTIEKFPPGQPHLILPHLNHPNVFSQQLARPLQLHQMHDTRVPQFYDELHDHSNTNFGNARSLSVFPVSQPFGGAPMLSMPITTSMPSYNCAPVYMGDMLMRGSFHQGGFPVDSQQMSTTVHQNLVRPTNRTSLVWHHFKISSTHSRPGRAVCDHCGKEVQHGSSTSNLASHLRIRHSEVVAGTPLSRPPPCLGPDRKPRVRKPKSETAQLSKFEDAIIKWATVTGQSLDTFENKYFKRMISLANPRAIIPPREHFERALKIKNSSINVDAVLHAENYSRISWIATMMSSLKKKIHSLIEPAAAEGLSFQLDDLARRYSDKIPPEMGVDGLPIIPSSCLVASVLDPRFKKLRALEKFDKVRAWQVTETSLIERQMDIIQKEQCTMNVDLSRKVPEISNILLSQEVSTFSQPVSMPIFQSTNGQEHVKPTHLIKGSFPHHSGLELELSSILPPDNLFEKDLSDTNTLELLISGGHASSSDDEENSNFYSELKTGSSSPRAKRKGLALDQIRNELSRYKLVASIPGNSDPFRWWQEQSITFPLLFDLAQTTLGK